MAIAGEAPVIGTELRDPEVVFFWSGTAEDAAEVAEDWSGIVDVEGEGCRGGAAVDDPVEDAGGIRDGVVEAFHGRAEAIEDREAARADAETADFEGGPRREGVGCAEGEGAAPDAGSEGAGSSTARVIRAAQGDIGTDVVDLDVAGSGEGIAEGEVARAVDGEKRGAAAIGELDKRGGSEVARAAARAQLERASGDLGDPAKAGIVVRELDSGAIGADAVVADHEATVARDRAFDAHVACARDVDPVNEACRVRVEPSFAIDGEGFAGASDHERIGGSARADSADIAPIVEGHVSAPAAGGSCSAEPCPEGCPAAIDGDGRLSRHVRALRLDIPRIEDDVRKVDDVRGAEVEAVAGIDGQGVATAVERLACRSVANVDGLRATDRRIAGQGQAADGFVGVDVEVMIDDGSRAIRSRSGD